ncbi:MAG TPA: hypothetical protein QGH18_05110, partial [Arenicellales bacterium]|nr:hypothetical protein [Arenicellales bacterium]
MSSRSASFLKGERASCSQAWCRHFEKSRLNGQTRMQIAQSEVIFAQKEKHFSASDVHLRTPWIAEGL